MSNYADSSFFVSLHIIDRHSAEVWKRMSAHPVLWVTPLHRAEFAGAAFLHVFWKKATATAAEKAISAFNGDIANGLFTISGLPEQCFERSVSLSRSYGSTLGVRTLDSLHVACALELRAEKFWTFDERQARLAEAVGLDTTP